MVALSEWSEPQNTCGRVMGGWVADWLAGCLADWLSVWLGGCLGGLMAEVCDVTGRPCHHLMLLERDWTSVMTC